MQTVQERLLAALGQHTVGSAFVFAPENYQKGSGTREPCDVVWFANGVAVLIACTGGNKPLEAQDQHNLRQLRGWVRAWKRGEPLRGSNAVATFHIPHAAVEHLVLLSVCEGAGASLRAHPDETCIALGATIVATVTASFLVTLTQLGGACRDLIDSFAYLRTPRAEGAAIDHLRALRDAAQRAVHQQVGRIEPVDPPTHLVAETILARMRGLPGVSARRPDGTESGSDNRAAEIFNDLGWPERLMLIATLARAAAEKVALPRGARGVLCDGHSFDLGPYFYVLETAVDIGAFGDLGPRITSYRQQAGSRELVYGGVYYLREADSFGAVFFVDGTKGRSMTSACLDSLRPAGRRR